VRIKVVIKTKGGDEGKNQKKLLGFPIHLVIFSNPNIAIKYILLQEKQSQF